MRTLTQKCEYLKSIGYSFDNKQKMGDRNVVVPGGIQLTYPEYSVIDLRINSFTTLKTPPTTTNTNNKIGGITHKALNILTFLSIIFDF